MSLYPRPLLDAAWRAALHCFHLRVILLSVLPVLLVAGAGFAAAYFLWVPVLDLVRDLLETWDVYPALDGWLNGLGLAGLKLVLVPFVVLCLATPLAVLLCLLAVGVFMTPAMLRLVASRRFPALERRHGGSFAGSLLAGAAATCVAVLALVASLPLWLLPPLMLILPPLIWGWLTYRLMSYDVLSEHASGDERRELMRRHRASLLTMGVVTGWLSAAPSLLWVGFGAAFIIAAPLLVPVAVWLYTLVFAFSALWFAHYALAALASLRDERTGRLAPAGHDTEPATALPAPTAFHDPSHGPSASAGPLS